jgi:hypothetical protein
VDLVDEEDRVAVVLERGDHGLEALLELAAELGAGEQGAHVEGVDVGRGEGGGDLALDDAQGQALDDGGLADAGLADEHGVVLAAAAQHLDDALDLLVAADEQLDAAGLGLGVEVDGVGGQRVVGDGLVVVLFADGGAGRLAGRGLVAALGDAVRDEHGRVAAGHAELAQDGGGERLGLGEDRDEQVGAGDLVAAGALDVEDRALEDAADADGLVDGGLGVVGEAGVVLVDEGLESARRASMSAWQAMMTLRALGSSRRARRRCSRVMYSWRRRWVSAMAALIVCLSSVLSIGVLLGLQGGDQGAVLLTGEHVDLRDLGLGDLVGVDAGDADAVVVDVEHDGGRVGLAAVEEHAEQADDEFHGRVVVVVDQDPVHPGPGGLALGAGLEHHAALRAVLVLVTAGHRRSVGECSAPWSGACSQRKATRCPI